MDDDPGVTIRLQNAQQMCALFRKTIALEIRQCGLMREAAPWLPLPADIDAQSEILGALLTGDVAIEDLAPLRAKHIYGDFPQAVWNAIADSAPGDLEGILRCVATRGWRGMILDEIHQLMFCQPFCSLPRMRAHVGTLIELWRRREIIALMQQFDCDLRRGTVTADEAQRAIEKRCGEVRA